MEDFPALARLVDALRPWLGHLVLVGGWAHRLHRLHPLASPPAYQPIRTLDADLALALEAPIQGDIRKALRAAGFAEELSGDHRPPITQYRLGVEDAGFFAEFLVPLRGDGLRPDGTQDVTIAKAGITAQKMRHLELLLTEPWTVTVGPKAPIPTSKPVDVRIANPVSFLVQKILIQKSRKPQKQSQDALYIHDTLELFGPSLSELRKLWINVVRPSMSPRTARRVEDDGARMFEAVNDAIRSAALIPVDRKLDPERLRALGEYGLATIFSK